MNIFNKLFKRTKTEPSRHARASTGTARQEIIDIDPGMARHILVGQAQSIGLERKHNEDVLFVLTGNSSGEERLSDFGLFTVADGMGGHRSGEIASAIAARTVAKHLTQETLLNLFEIEPSQGNLPPLLDVMRNAILDANQQVVRTLPGGGTTITSVLLIGDQMTIGHVGDTRAYVITDSQAKVITRDHTFVERLLELGEVTQEEASIHPQRHVLYRAIGQGDALKADVFSYPTPHGGKLLLCSDGLWGVISDDDILDIVKHASNPQEACDRLVHAAILGGGPDNISTVLVQFPPKTARVSKKK
ncbi:MAG TPA: serine/threonine-protein phosphatase [Anaerolineae bacterium]|nr:serine/threonine-protein phosphatase [Anaerolineae bacterium]